MRLIVDIQKQLDSYTLAVACEVAGAPLGVLGSSGSGKSMTLRCIAGIETPTQGTIVLNDRILYDSRRGINLPSRDRSVGYLFQHYALFPHLTAAQNIAYGLRGLAKPARQRRVNNQLDQLKLSGLGNRYPHQLSGGQQQRVALARALAPAPELLLLDEPFSALDTHLRSELEQQLLKTLAAYSGQTLLVSHNLDEIYRVCPHLLVLSAGQVAAAGPKQAIFDRPGTLGVARLTGCQNYSRIQPIAPQKILALDWGCILETQTSWPAHHTHVGIRAHQITFPDRPDGPNTGLAWVASTSETPHRMTACLKLGAPPADVGDYHLRAEVGKDRWAALTARTPPWVVSLDPLNLISLTA